MTPGAPGEAEPAVSTARIDDGQSATTAAETPLYVAKLIVEHARRDAEGVAKLLEVVFPRGKPANQALPRGFVLGGRLFRAGASPSLRFGFRRGDAEPPRSGAPRRTGERLSTRIGGGGGLRP